jgi:hypothetical protein
VTAQTFNDLKSDDAFSRRDATPQEYGWEVISLKGYFHGIQVP